MSKLNGWRTETVHFDPMLFKSKCVWEAVDLFKFLKMCLQSSAFCFQLFKKSTASQTHFGFTNIGSKAHRFSSTATYFRQFSIGSSDSEHPVEWTEKVVSQQLVIWPLAFIFDLHQSNSLCLKNYLFLDLTNFHFSIFSHWCGFISGSSILLDDCCGTSIWMAWQSMFKDFWQQKLQRSRRSSCFGGQL